MRALLLAAPITPPNDATEAQSHGGKPETRRAKIETRKAGDPAEKAGTALPQFSDKGFVVNGLEGFELRQECI
jgi:hypothetical protein